jgi:malonate transporter
MTIDHAACRPNRPYSFHMPSVVLSALLPVIGLIALGFVRPAAAYILSLAMAFVGMLVVRGLNRTAAVLTLAATYSNAVMIGIPLVTLAWGDAGLVTLLTLIPVHSLLLLTSATPVLEFAVSHEQVARTANMAGRMLRVTGRALRKALIHQVCCPSWPACRLRRRGWRYRR